MAPKTEADDCTPGVALSELCQVDGIAAVPESDEHSRRDAVTRRMRRRRFGRMFVGRRFERRFVGRRFGMRRTAFPFSEIDCLTKNSD